MLYFAMAGLVTAIHVYKTLSASTTWRAEATPSFGRLCPGMTEKQ